MVEEIQEGGDFAPPPQVTIGLTSMSTVNQHCNRRKGMRLQFKVICNIFLAIYFVFGHIKFHIPISQLFTGRYIH